MLNKPVLGHLYFADSCEGPVGVLLIQVYSVIEQFSIECRKTKTKVITTANQNKDKYHNEPMRTQSKYM